MALPARDHLDKAALVVAFLFGAAGSWASKLLGFGPFVAVAWTLAAMAFYVAAVVILGRLRIEPEAIGDNCYYLGFLLTLSSLSATLWQLTQSDEQAELMRAIVGGFGIALVSTILGILLRVIFIQLRPDIVARERETRIELSRAARELRLELASSVAAMKDFTTEAIQMASEQGSRMGSLADAAVEAQRERMRSDAEAQAAMLRETMAATGTRVGEAVERAAVEAQASVRASLEAMSRGIAAFAEAQTAALGTPDANEARAARAAAEIDLLSARVATSVDLLTQALERSVSAAEAARMAADDAAARAARAAEGARPAGRFGLWRG